MEPCHLVAAPEAAQQLVHQETLYHSAHEVVWLCQCPLCQQAYLGYLVEVRDDSWTFWVALDPADLLVLRADHTHAKALVQSRRHLVELPRWRAEGLSWREGNEPALAFGPRGS